MEEVDLSPPAPPFRADHIGSLLRPKEVARSRVAHSEGRIQDDELREIEDRFIGQAIRLQQDVGLKAVTDGEYRRAFWHYDFMGMLDGMTLEERDEGISFAGATLKPIYPVLTGKLGFPDNHPMLNHFRYVAGKTSVVPKMSIPGPSCCHFRIAPDDIHPPEYADPEVLMADIARTYRKAVQCFYDAGCRYLQMDDIFFAYLCDPVHRQAKQDIGQDPDWLVDRYAWMMRQAIKDRPQDMIIGMHMCRGNFMSAHAATGAYDPVADTVLNKTGVDIFFMEYDTRRAGGLAPLKYLAKGHQRVMPGFVTTKTPELESRDKLLRLFDQAARHVDLMQLGLAPQCGFASTEEGNKLSEMDQWKKLELVVRTAEEIWGEV